MPATLRFTLLLVLIAVVAALIAVRERPHSHGTSMPVPAAVR